MFTRNSSAVPKLLGPHSTTPAGTENAITTPSTGEKSIIGNDLKIVGQGLKIISRGILQVDGEIEGDVMAAAARRRVKSCLRDQCTWLQISEISVQFVGPIRWIQWGARRTRRHGELPPIPTHEAAQRQSGRDDPFPSPATCAPSLQCAEKDGSRSSARAPAQGSPARREYTSLDVPAGEAGTERNGGPRAEKTSVRHGFTSQPRQNYRLPLRGLRPRFLSRPNTPIHIDTIQLHQPPAARARSPMSSSRPRDSRGHT